MESNLQRRERKPQTWKKFACFSLLLVCGSSIFTNQMIMKFLMSSSKAPDANRPNAMKSLSQVRESAYDPAVLQSSNYAYVVFLTKPAFIPGVLSLMNGLKKTQTVHDRIVLYTFPLQQHILDLFHSSGIRTRNVHPLDYDLVHSEAFTRHPIYDYSPPRVLLRAWQLTDYRKVMILGHDLVVFSNLDDIFEELTPAIPFHETSLTKFQKDDSRAKKKKRLIANTRLLLITPNEAEFRHMVSSSTTTASNVDDYIFLREYFKKAGQINRLDSSLILSSNDEKEIDLKVLRSVQLTCNDATSKEELVPWENCQSRVNRSSILQHKIEPSSSSFVPSQNLAWILQQFWRNYDDAWVGHALPLSKMISVSGMWEGNDEFGSVLYLHQYQSRVTVNGFFNQSTSPFLLGNGVIYGDILALECIRLPDADRHLFTVRLYYNTTISPLPYFNAELSFLPGQEYQMISGVHGPDPRLPSSSLSGVWKDGEMNKWRIWDMGHQLLSFMTQKDRPGRITMISSLHLGVEPFSSRRLYGHGNLYGYNGPENSKTPVQGISLFSLDGAKIAVSCPSWRSLVILTPENDLKNETNVGLGSIQRFYTGLKKQKYKPHVPQCNPFQGTVKAMSGIPLLSGTWRGYFQPRRGRARSRLDVRVNIYQHGERLYISQDALEGQGLFGIGSIDAVGSTLTPKQIKAGNAGKTVYFVRLELFHVGSSGMSYGNSTHSYWFDQMSRRHFYYLNLESSEEGSFLLFSNTTSNYFQLQSTELKSSDCRPTGKAATVEGVWTDGYYTFHIMQFGFRVTGYSSLPLNNLLVFEGSFDSKNVFLHVYYVNKNESPTLLTLRKERQDVWILDVSYGLSPTPGREWKKVG
eukprot:TRINITY_DN11666_c0_g1_i1.p1 TRINITY_DN11666_c0_g1~~TRINITY_DN11666_c0_g1_i1.p1  ORF type:complete len:863 (-),score=108.84 TRINITY_DN11666_c0_g1_i1:208-2796(-)